MFSPRAEVLKLTPLAEVRLAVISELCDLSFQTYSLGLERTESSGGERG
jgi:hypothetical protein